MIVCNVAVIWCQIGVKEMSDKTQKWVTKNALYNTLYNTLYIVYSCYFYILWTEWTNKIVIKVYAMFVSSFEYY